MPAAASPTPASRRATAIAVAAAFAAPIAVVLLVSVAMFDSSTPDIVDPAQRQPDVATAITMLADLSQTMTAMAIGILIGATWLFRQPLRPTAPRGPWLCLVTAAMLGLGSIYAGLRFRYDVAIQIIDAAFALDLVKDRLFLQGAALLLQFATFCAAATLYHRHRDGRARGAQ